MSKTYAITGITGLLGRNLLFEILKNNLANLAELKIFAFGRSGRSSTLLNRLKQMLVSDGANYLGVDLRDNSALLSQLLNCLIPIEFDLSRPDLAISDQDRNKFKALQIDYFFHLGALSDFRNTPEVKSLLDKINVQGTLALLGLFSRLQVKEIIYVGSAYSSGRASGLIKADYVNLDEKFRNEYEKSKLIGEIHFRDFALRNNYKYRVFRPIGICGRLLEKPLGAVSKYDIFYGWAAFFLRQKLKIVKNPADVYAQRFNVPVRIQISKKSGQNIVPCDYAAKMMYAVCAHNVADNSFNLVNDVDIPHTEYVRLMLDTVGAEGYNFVDQEPEDKNAFETLYYRTVGSIFTPYVTGATLKFDTSNLAEIKKKTGIECPKMTRDNFLVLMKYAKQHYFGLNIPGGKEK